MKTSLFFICALTLLTGCMGGYVTSKCNGRVKDLKNLAGNYAIPEAELEFKIVRKAAGQYNITQEGQVVTALTTCVVKGQEIAEVTGDGVYMALTRKNKDLIMTSFDTAVLDAAGVKYQTGTSDEWGITIVAVEEDMTDEVFAKALIETEVTIVKQ